MTLSVVIVDDSPSFLESARALLQSQGLDVIGVATNPAEAVERVRQHRPEVVVVDLHLGAVSGLEVASELSAEATPPAVVLVSSIGYDDLAALADGAPVRGFLTKTDLSAAAVESIVRGRSVPR